MYFKLLTRFSFVFIFIGLVSCASIEVSNNMPATVSNYDRRSAEIKIMDEAIENLALSRLKWMKKRTYGSDARLIATSYGRRVLLLGEVPTASDKNLVEIAVGSIDNVLSVINQIQVMSTSSLGQGTEDLLVTAKIKAELLNSKDIPFNAFKIITNRGVVYILGTSTVSEVAPALHIARTTMGVKKVVNMVEHISERGLAQIVLQQNTLTVPRAVAASQSTLSVTASASFPDSNGVVILSITTNSDTASLKINGDEAGGRADGRYSVNRFAQIGSNNFKVVATDRFGNTQRKNISVFRQAADNTVRFDSLNPIAVRARPATNAVAIIIGIQDYSRVPDAEFANNDARVFYDYAIRGLGVRSENIKLLLDQEADQVEILSAFKNWLPLKTRTGQTDVYVFYSGHGLPSDDGSNLYMLPHGVDRQFLNETAIKQSVLIDSLQAVSPRSVTMFMDACYSGQTRTGETLLVSARPIAIQSKASSFPANFNVISASAPDQLASSSPDLKHGVFSYFLMKGMEGEADENKDGNITMTEMLSYLKENVGKKAMSLNRTQQPQLSGDGARVLVGR